MRACVDPQQLSLLLRTVPSGRSQSVVGRQLRHSGHRSRGQSGRRFRRPWLSRSAVFPRIRKNSKKGAGQCLSRWYNALAFGVGEVLHRQASGPALVAHGPDARIAQLVEQRIENPRVGGSNPPPGTTSSSRLYPAKTCHLAPLRWVLCLVAQFWGAERSTRTTAHCRCLVLRWCSCIPRCSLLNPAHFFPAGSGRRVLRSLGGLYPYQPRGFQFGVIPNYTN